MRKVSVLVVCTGNICRSPTAEGVLKQLVRKRGLADRVEVRSAGTHDYHVGDAPDGRAIDHAHRRGYDLSAQRAQRIAREHFTEYDYILAMDRGHLRILRQIAPAGARAQLGLFLDASVRWQGEDVPDPYYGDAEGFEQVLDMVEEASEHWLERIQAEIDRTAG